MAQMERELKAERTAAGRAAAKARGRTGGRPRTDPDKLEQARILSSPCEQDRRERVPHRGDWSSDVVQLPGASERPKGGQASHEAS